MCLFLCLEVVSKRVLFVVAQLKKQLRNPGLDNKRKTDLEDSIACLEAADKLSVVNLCSGLMTHAQIKKHVETVEELGHKIPVYNRILISKIYTVELLESQNDVEWVEALVPVMKDSSAEVKWTAAQPLWAGCELSDESVSQFKTHWVEGVLANGIWNMLENMTDQSQRSRFVRLVKRFLAEMDHVATVLNTRCSKDVQEGFGTVFASAMKMFRGLLGLACPSPGNAQLEDVQYVMPSNASTADLVKDLPGGSGRALISMLRKDKNNFWADANSEFLVTIGFAAQISDEYVAMEVQIHCVMDKLNMQRDSAAVTEIGAEKIAEVNVTVVSLFDSFGNVFHRWNVGLRVGGLDELSACFNVLASSVFEFMQRRFPDGPFAGGNFPTWYAPMLQSLKVLLPFLKNEARTNYKYVCFFC